MSRTGFASDVDPIETRESEAQRSGVEQRVCVSKVHLENTVVDVHGPALVSIPEAARLLGISRASAYRYADSGQLPGARRLGRRVFVVRARLIEFLEAERDDAGGVEAA
ncbi:helix-turn-helix domain-containing protein [Lentzea cavernae]|uniref:Helix-turn-helix domain-containing protein n=1 Tax=Lentzea cavernae TaxID=2020703 RepID=A0ABQ3N4K3_9PSEU|nr:helix-turn-helix domain-containing protein [Lentzea cavernae]GHH62367.1 hypothetical protein GCM10017774_89990 [Lentzea cavernae]